MTIGRIPSVEGGIQPTIVDAKGDLIAATAADSVSRLAVGTNDYFLQAASGETTGLKWGGAWSTYSPTWTNVTVGNGTLIARYLKVGKMVTGGVELTLGSTSSITGQIIVSLPTTPANNNVLLRVWFQDTGTAGYVGAAEMSGGNIYLYAINSAGTYAAVSGTSGTIPMTWTTNDVIRVSFVYEEA